MSELEKNIHCNMCNNTDQNGVKYGFYYNWEFMCDEHKPGWYKNLSETCPQAATFLQQTLEDHEFRRKWEIKRNNKINSLYQTTSKLEKDIAVLKENYEFERGRAIHFETYVYEVTHDDSIIKALRWYADEENWLPQETGEMCFAGLDTLVPKEIHPALDDKGTKAREVLQEIENES